MTKYAAVAMGLLLVLAAAVLQRRHGPGKPSAPWAVPQAAEQVTELAELPSGDGSNRSQEGLSSAMQGGGSLPPEPATLGPGDELQMDWVIGAGTIVQGELLGQDDAPVKGVEIWLVAAKRAEDRRFHEVDGANASRATTDSAGRFRFESVRPGTWLIGPGVQDGGRPGRAAPWTVWVEIEPDAAQVDVTLAAALDLALDGVVLDPGGAPTPRAWVHLASEDGSHHSLRADEKGQFQARGLRPVQYTLTAGGMGQGHGRSAEVAASPGDASVSLRLRTSGEIQGRVAGLQGIDGLPLARITARTPPNRQDESIRVAVRADGYFLADGLVPGLYDVFVSAQDGCCALVASHRVEAGRSTTELPIELSGGAELTLELGTGNDPVSYRLIGRGALLAKGRCTDDQPKLHQVPAGQIDVVYERGKGPTASQSVTLPVGGSSTLELR